MVDSAPLTARERPKVTKPRTVHEVAKLANVSIATVSRALNNPESVREELRQRVIDAARQLGYATNPAAKALRERRSKIVAVVVPTLDDEAFSRLVGGLQSVLTANGYAAFVQVAGFDNSDIYEAVKGLFDRGAEALAIVGRIYDRKLLKLISERQIPAVVMYSRLDDETVPSIGIDNAKATDKLFDHLLALGHRQFAMIAGTPKGNDRQQIRIDAFAKRIAELSIGDPLVYTVDRRYTLQDGAVAADEIVRLRPDITAVICTSPIITLGVLSEFRRNGVSVPDRMAVVGFDDFTYASLVSPAVTALSVPSTEIGRLTAEALVGKLDHGREILSLELAVQIQVRGSTAPPQEQS